MNRHMRKAEELVGCACRSLWRRRSRTLLTVSGILVGVLMVVLVSVMGEAGTQAVGSELENLGMSGLSVRAGKGASLTGPELELIRNQRAVESAMPLLLEYSKASMKDRECQTFLCGIDAGADQVIALETAHGRMLNRGDIGCMSHVCVVDQSVARELYGRENITGKTLKLSIGGIEETFTVVGVAKTGSSLLQNLVEYIPGLVYVPYTTLQGLCGRDTFDQIAVRVTAEADAQQAEQTLVAALERSTGMTDSFETENLAAQRERLDTLLRIVSIILTAISGISLLVSGMGIMTIMLVSVSERVREIGVKKAIGASRGRIMAEFLAESVMLSLLGAVCGMVLGLAAGLGGAAWFGIHLAFPWKALGGILLFSLLLGAAFGAYPAWKAASLPPVEALRSDV